MRSVQRTVWQVVLLTIAFVCFCSVCVFAQQALGTLRGQVVDEFGGLIIGATVTVADAHGVVKTSTTNDDGSYVFPSLSPGIYTVRVTAQGFAEYENTAVEVTAGKSVPLNITLSAAIEQTEVTVTAESSIGTDAENNAGAIVLRNEDLDALPDDPEELAEALQALAGPSSGLDGGSLFIDGFSGGRIPPKESIREIRINSNPFSAEYDRLGFGRTEIFTKPGTDKLRGQSFFNFNDESLNTRNPFAPNRDSFQLRRYGGNISGSIVPKRASFFFDIERRETDDNEVIRATILDPQLNVTQFSQTVLTPVRGTSFGSRVDYQLNQSNTLVARYTYDRSSTLNSGVGDFSLLSRAYDTSNNEHRVQVTETAIIKQKYVNETRFQYVRERRTQEGDNSVPTLRVLDAFTGGGSQVGLSSNEQDRWELQNYTSWSVGQHTLKTGGRIRGVRINDISAQNFGGTYTFSGGNAPQLDANNQVVIDPMTGLPVTISITSIERYRRTLLFRQLNLSPTEIRTRGGGATQFSIAGGNSQANVTQVDFSPFIQDDWRVRPNLTLSLGLRYETQTNIGDRTNFAPRIAFAYAPKISGGSGGGARQQQTTVIRGGFGLFYERLGENLTLQANRFNGNNQQQFVVTNATASGITVLDLFPNVPSIAQLSTFAIPQTTRRVAPDLHAPYTMQATISIERQLPYRTTLSASFISSRTLHVLRSRNINAPVPVTNVRPFGNTGNIFQYESSGRFNQNQLVINVNSRFSQKITLFATYVLNSAKSDTDGTFSFPINQYDLSNEYGRSSIGIRHRFSLGGAITAPWKIRLNPFITANSGRPFNITTGRDTNGDTLFTERPAFATDLTRQSVKVTRFGTFDSNPITGQQIIPRNYGTGPSFFSVNLRVSRTFGFGGERSGSAGARTSGGQSSGQGGGQGGRGGGGGQGGQGGGPFGGGSGETPSRYNLAVSVNVQNLLNHTNLGTPIGNLSSTLFGQSNTSAGRFGFGANQSAGNRRVELQLRFSF
jgi:hypothetical protein